MIKRTQEEVLAVVEAILDGEHYYDPEEKTSRRIEDFKVEAEKVSDGWRITIKRMYEYVSLGLKELITLSEFFGTKNITDERWSIGGCETCDYGSSYEITLYVKE